MFKKCLLVLVALSFGVVQAEVINLDFTEREKVETASLSGDLYYSISEVGIVELPVYDDSETMNLISSNFNRQGGFVPPVDDLVPTNGNNNGPFNHPSKDTNAFDTVIMVVDKIIAVGEKIVKLVNAGKPVSSYDLKPYHILPRTEEMAGALYSMENWTAPKVKRYNVFFKNGYGSKVVDFTFFVIFQHNGTYNGTGKYITGLQVVAEKVVTSWGYTFDAQTALVAISNRGTMDNPIAGATINLIYKVSNPMRVIDSAASYHITGRGELLEL